MIEYVKVQKFLAKIAEQSAFTRVNHKFSIKNSFVVYSGIGRKSNG
jgi:hypothetical protein